MIGQFVDLLAPDYCCGCDRVGAILCESCYYDIIDEPFNRCVSCLKPTGVSHSCTSCRLPYQKSWVVGWREGALERLVDVSKFDSVRRACIAQAKLLDATLPQLPQGTVVAAVPTSRPHIRRRGYGHAELIAKQLAKLRGLDRQSVLHRRNQTVQHGATRQQRLKQAKHAYMTSGQIDSKNSYLLVDDVFTTGATASSAALALKKAGANTVWLAVTSRQPLD